MRAIGTLLIACVALAVVKAAIAVLLLALAIALVWALCLYPRELFTMVTYITCMGMISEHPLIGLLLVGTAVITCQFYGSRGEAS